MNETSNRLLRLREDFDRATAKPIAPRSDDRVNYLVFKLERESLAWPTASLTEILANRRIVLIPGRQDSLYGVINFKNRVLTVSNLHHRFNLAAVRPDENNIILVSRGLAVDTALLVDDLVAILSVAAGEIKPKPMSLDPETAQMIVGEFHHRGQMVTVLNPDAFSA